MILDGTVERRSWDDASALDAIRNGTPIVLAGCPLHKRMVGRWTFSHLARASFDGSERLNVHVAPSDDVASFERVYASGLNASQDCDVQAMSFREFFTQLLPELLPPASPHLLGFDPPWKHTIPPQGIYMR